MHRAAWASYEKIAEKTGISLPTVIKTCKARKEDIDRTREIARQRANNDNENTGTKYTRNRKLQM